MIKAKRSRWCNPLEGVRTEERGLRFWVLKVLERAKGVGAREARAGGRGPSSYIYVNLLHFYYMLITIANTLILEL